MKFLFSIFVALAVMAVVAVPVLASKPAKQTCTTIQDETLMTSGGETISTGFDQWGYNYQAKMFNGKYCDAYKNAAWCEDYADDNLIMKWNDAWLSNKDCDGDKKLDRHYGFTSYIGSGAWLTNHQSGTYDEFMSWNVSGTWLLDFGSGTDNREFRNLVQDEDGSVTGEFWWLNSSNWEYGGTLVGNIIDNKLTLHYERPPELNYNGDFVSTISETGLDNGSFTDSKGGTYVWTATGVDPAVYETCDWNYFVKIVAAPKDAVLSGGTWYTDEYKEEEIGPAVWGEFAIIQEVYNDACAGYNGLMSKSPVRAGLGNW